MVIIYKGTEERLPEFKSSAIQHLYALVSSPANRNDNETELRKWL